ncbi:MAG: hypothetical protein GEU96_02830 [Propionibacteriales bacterium]|nr:hypothetical protein [Propionibacteriales bacterium]
MTAVTGARRVEVAPERLAGWIERFGRLHGDVQATGSASTVDLAAADGSTAQISVPWPPLPPADGDDAVAGLLAHVAARRRLALLLVRRGGYALGLLDGDQLTVSKVGSRYVQGRTKAGGWSQQRYARRRAHQAKEAFGAAADVAARMFLPAYESIDGLVTGGDRQAVADVLSDPRLLPLADLPVGPFLAVPDPRKNVLEQAAVACRAVRVEVADVTR